MFYFYHNTVTRACALLLFSPTVTLSCLLFVSSVSTLFPVFISLTSENVWTNSQISLLLETIQEHKCLCEVKNKDYHNKIKRNAAFEELAIILSSIRENTTPADCVKKWNGLRNTYATERRKYIESLKSGAGEENVSTKYKIK